MNKDLPHNPRTRQIVEAFIAWWKSGGRTRLDGEQIMMLNTFCDFIMEYEKEPPALGVSVEENVGVKDEPK